MKVYWHGTDKKWVMSVIRFAVKVTVVLLVLNTVIALFKIGQGWKAILASYFFPFFSSFPLFPVIYVILWGFVAYEWYQYRLTNGEPRVMMELLPDRLLVYSDSTGKVKLELFYSDLETFTFGFQSHAASSSGYPEPGRSPVFQYKKQSEKEGKDFSFALSYWLVADDKKIEEYAMVQTILDFVHEKMGMSFDYPTIDWDQVSQLTMKISKESLGRQLVDSVTKLFHQGESVRSEVYAVITSDGIDKADLLTQSIKHYAPSEMKNLTVDWWDIALDNANHLLPRIAFLYDGMNESIILDKNMYFELDDGTRFIPQTNAHLADLRKGVFKLLGVEGEKEK